MKYTITGGAGNVSGLLVRNLLKAGHDVKVIGRNAQKLQELVDAGAETAIGSVEDPEFLKRAFAGADAVYTMCPPNLLVKNLIDYHVKLGKNYAEAIRMSGIKFVVNLSSIGAHLASGAGPVSGVHLVENALNELEDVNVKHLRAGYFYQNLFFQIEMIRNAALIGNNFRKEEKELPLADRADIAEAATDELSTLNFSGHSYRYVISDETSTDEIAAKIGTAIGQPTLTWTTFTDEQSFEGLRQAGLSDEIARNYVDLGRVINSGILFEDYKMHRTGELGRVKLPDFINVFTSAYNHR